MEPVAREVRMPARAATLRDLALVVREDVVLAARVEVDLLAEEHLRHRAALEVPAGVALAPRARPAHEVRRIGLPQHEVGGMALRGLVRRAHAAALALAQLVERVAREATVRGKALDAEVDDAVAGDVRVPARDEPLDERDHLGDAARRPRHEFGVLALLERDLEPEEPRVLEEALRVERRDRVRIRRIDLGARGQLPRLLRLGDPPPRDRHLVLAAAIGVGVLGHVPDIGDVHHMPHAEALELERAPQDVGIEERPEVPDVRVVVDRRPARVEGHGAIARDRREGLGRLRERVVEAHGRSLAAARSSRNDCELRAARGVPHGDRPHARTSRAPISASNARIASRVSTQSFACFATTE